MTSIFWHSITVTRLQWDRVFSQCYFWGFSCPYACPAYQARGGCAVQPSFPSFVFPIPTQPTGRTAQQNYSPPPNSPSFSWCHHKGIDYYWHWSKFNPFNNLIFPSLFISLKWQWGLKWYKYLSLSTGTIRTSLLQFWLSTIKRNPKDYVTNSFPSDGSARLVLGPSFWWAILFMYFIQVYAALHW